MVANAEDGSGNGGGVAPSPFAVAALNPTSDRDIINGSPRKEQEVPYAHAITSSSDIVTATGPHAFQRLSMQASAQALKRYSELRSTSVQSALGALSHFSKLRDAAGLAFVDAHNLTKVKDLGQGAYAIVEHCRLANWYDASVHGGATAGAIATALQHADSAASDSGGPAADADVSERCARPCEGKPKLSRSSGGGRAAELAPPGSGLAQLPAELDVAVKHLRPQLFSNQVEVADFIKEATLCASLYHRSIVPVLGVGFRESAGAVSEESIFMVTELCNSGTLKDKILQQMLCPRKAVYSWAQGAEWCAQVSQGLAFLHAQQPLVIHRDVKLENILLHSSGEDGALEAKLGDFGLHATVQANRSAHGQRIPAAALHKEDSVRRDSLRQHALAAAASAASGVSSSSSRRRSSLSCQRPSFDSSRTRARVRSMVRTRSSSGAGAAARRLHELTGQTGSFLGMAPEVTLGKPYNEKADVFSLGCVIVDVLGKQLTAAEVAYTGTPAEFMKYAVSVAHGYRRPHPRNWPPGLGALVAACLAQEPADRPAASEVATRLRALAAAGAFTAMDGRRRGGGCGCMG